MQRLLLLIISLVLCGATALAQSRYIGVIAQGSATSDKLGTNTPVGIGVRTAQPLGENVVTTGEFTYTKFKLDAVPKFPQHVLGVRGDIRYHVKAFGETVTLYPLAGVDVQRLKLFGFGQTFVQPKLGAGAAYGKIFTGHYYYAFRDLQSVFELQGHNVEGDVYLDIPGSDRWQALGGIRFQRIRVIQSPQWANVVTFTVGLGRLLGSQ